MADLSGQHRPPAISLEAFFLKRLDRFLRCRPSPTAPFNAELLRRWAIYSAYLDCRALGLGRVADWLLQGHGRIMAPPVG
ncbi:MAG TPA: hypothetical protein VFF52_05960 [Isosphaeraceae bacterium]|nr:hypothetical protein [Isosphaeraceae bacterium]